MCAVRIIAREPCVCAQTVVQDNIKKMLELYLEKATNNDCAILSYISKKPPKKQQCVMMFLVVCANTCRCMPGSIKAISWGIHPACLVYLRMLPCRSLRKNAQRPRVQVCVTNFTRISTDRQTDRQEAHLRLPPGHIVIEFLLIHVIISNLQRLYLLRCRSLVARRLRRNLCLRGVVGRRWC
jgi:hypothetical protein